MRLNQFREINICDFEFIADPGEKIVPVCCVFTELRSGITKRLWHSDFGQQPPYSTDSGALFVAYSAAAEMGCHAALNWPMPCRILDLFAEYRCMFNGLGKPSSQLAAMEFYGHEDIARLKNIKEVMRIRILEGFPYTDAERAAILDYCQSDVDGLRFLFDRMAERVDQRLVLALNRGDYGRAVAKIERFGIPMDVPLVDLILSRQDEIKLAFIANSRERFPDVYDAEGHFHANRLIMQCEAEGIEWPRLPTGRLWLADDAFKEMSEWYPHLKVLRDARNSVDDMRLGQLPIGRDGRNRPPLKPWASKTARNQPSKADNDEGTVRGGKESGMPSIFGSSSYLRRTIKPPPGRGLVYVDWAQQEPGIAAYLSGDAELIAACESGDIYLGMAKADGRVPHDATVQSHKAIRDSYKPVLLGITYGMQERSLARRLGVSVREAREILRRLRSRYKTYFTFAQGVLDTAMILGTIETVFGWELHTPLAPNPRSIANFAIQANAAEMMRIGAIEATDAGLNICAVVHDAFLLEAPLADLEDARDTLQRIMREASSLVLGGPTLRSDAKLIRYPDSYYEGDFDNKRGEKIWGELMAALRKCDLSPEQRRLVA